MAVVRSGTCAIRSVEDVVAARRTVREFAKAVGFSLIDETKIVTAASELARNVIQHAGGGSLHLVALNDHARRGLRLVFEDHGPGIANVEKALRDGFSTCGGLGLGGARRLVNEFEFETMPGVGITRWK